MSVVREVTEMLNSSGIKHLKYAYPFSIPNSSLINMKPDEVLLSVSEVRSAPTEYGSDIHTELDQDIQVKICYPHTHKVDTDAFEQSIVSFFYTQNFRFEPSMGHYIDPHGNVEVDLNFRRRK